MAALLAWRLQNRDRLQAILLLLDALQREAWADRHRHSAAQENHRAYVAQMRWRVAALLEPVAERGVLQQENPGLAVGLWALNVTTPALERRLEALLS
jgi:thioesterase domain-containing protein